MKNPDVSRHPPRVAAMYVPILIRIFHTRHFETDALMYLRIWVANQNLMSEMSASQMSGRPNL